MQIKTRAKINLSIDVLGKRSDGYHLVEMIMQSIDLYDIIKIEENDFNIINIKSNSSDIPVNDDNIVYKAIKIIKDTFNINQGINVYIEKNIPVAAGLAGGSSNCAGILVGLNKLWNLNLSNNKLKEIGLKLGADVPFCIEGGCYLAKNIGEELEPTIGLDEKLYLVVCKPEIFVSTKFIYESLNLNDLGPRPNNKDLINLLNNKNNLDLKNSMNNVLENVATKKYSEIEDIKSIISNNNSLVTMMSGSGPTVFGIFDLIENANKAKSELLKKYKQVYLTSSSKKGVEIIE
ncbi:MAG: 4-(cytidine 5'-diphospho)-2-C-methyl-D-erythritol kinase [Peptostreptococcaceae bacterium]